HASLSAKLRTCQVARRQSRNRLSRYRRRSNENSNPLPWATKPCGQILATQLRPAARRRTLRAPNRFRLREESRRRSHSCRAIDGLAHPHGSRVASTKRPPHVRTRSSFRRIQTNGG